MHNSHACANPDPQDNPRVEKDTTLQRRPGDDHEQFDNSCLHPPLLWPQFFAPPPPPHCESARRPEFVLAQPPPLPPPPPPLPAPPESPAPTAAGSYGNVGAFGDAHPCPPPALLLASHEEQPPAAKNRSNRIAVTVRISPFGSVYHTAPPPPPPQPGQQRPTYHPPMIVPPNALVAPSADRAYLATGSTGAGEALTTDPTSKGEGGYDDSALLDAVRHALRTRRGVAEERERCLDTVGRIFRAPRLRKMRSRHQPDDGAAGEGDLVMVDVTARLLRGRVAGRRRQRTAAAVHGTILEAVRDVGEGSAVRTRPTGTNSTMDWSEEAPLVQQRHCG